MVLSFKNVKGQTCAARNICAAKGRDRFSGCNLFDFIINFFCCRMPVRAGASFVAETGQSQKNRPDGAVSVGFMATIGRAANAGAR